MRRPIVPQVALEISWHEGDEPARLRSLDEMAWSIARFEGARVRRAWVSRRDPPGPYLSLRVDLFI